MSSVLLVFFTRCTPLPSCSSCGGPSIETSTELPAVTTARAGLRSGVRYLGGVEPTAPPAGEALPIAATTCSGGAAVGANAPSHAGADCHSPDTRVYHVPFEDCSRMNGVFVARFQPVEPSGASAGAPPVATATAGDCMTVIVGMASERPGVDAPRALTSCMPCSRLVRVVVIATR